MAISYLHLVIIFVAALAVLLGVFIMLKRPWHSEDEGLLGFLNHHHTSRDDLNGKYLLPLLVYEETYPAFGKILGLVLKKFPMTRFLHIEEFEKALYYLSNSVFDTADRQDLLSAMSVVVTTFISDPDVEFHCRPDLKILVDQFIEEAEDVSRTA